MKPNKIFIKSRISQSIPASPFSPFSPSFPSGPSLPGGPMGPMAPDDPGGPGFPSGPAGPGRLQTSCEVWMVMFRPLLGKAYRDWQQASASKQQPTHICSMTVTMEPPKAKKKELQFQDGATKCWFKQEQKEGTRNQKQNRSMCKWHPKTHKLFLFMEQGLF